MLSEAHNSYKRNELNTNRRRSRHLREEKCNGGKEDQTVAVLVKQAERLLELRDLVVSELVRHASCAIAR